MEVLMRSASRFLFGFILGGLVGSGLAFLFAPEAGEDTRTNVKQYFDRVKEEVQLAMLEKRAEQENELAKLRLPQSPSKETDISG
jgi:gas vesicle protein